MCISHLNLYVVSSYYDVNEAGWSIWIVGCSTPSLSWNPDQLVAYSCNTEGMPKWPKVWYPVPNLPPRLHENEHSRTPGVLLKLDDGANLNKPGMKVVCIYCRLAWLYHLHQLVSEPGSSSLDDLFFASVWGWKSQVSIVSEFAFVKDAGVPGALPDMPGGVCPSWVIRAVQRMRSSRPGTIQEMWWNDSRDSGRWVFCFCLAPAPRT